MSTQPTTPQNPPMTFADRAALVTPFGVPVAPLKPRSKDPFLNDWQHLATTDETQIAAWAEQNPAYNCAAVARKGGVWILDIDDPSLPERIKTETGHSLDELDTLVVKSSGGKRHHYFKQNSRSEAMGNVDADAEGGGEIFSARVHHKYVVCPGSIHPVTGQPYEIVSTPVFGDIPVAPAWLIDWISACSKSTGHTKTQKVPEIIPEGSRNKTLASLAGSMRHRGASESAILAALRVTNVQQCRPPLDDSELATIAQSISKYPPATDDEPDDEKQSDTVTPIYPMDTIDGDLIGELTRTLTDGTFIPPQFMRENIKVALGLIIDGLVGYPNHEDLHTREYLHNVSVYPQSGKGESYKRSIALDTGFLFELLRKFGVSIVDGGLFGSGEFMVKILKDAPTHRSIARFDEMSEVWSKNRALGCTLEKKLLTLFESTSVAQGSFKNGVHADSDFHVSVVGDFTKDSFDTSFTGSGSRGSGYLSRCIFQFADKQPVDGDWQLINTEKVRRILSDIEARLAEITSHDGRFIPSETADAKSRRLEFYAWLDTQDARFTPRLKDHLKRDVLLRAAYSDGSTITAEMMRRSIEWCKNQLDNRLALFPEDAGSAVEIMERCILRDINVKGQAPERELKKACNVNRAGSGGHEVFNRALRSLMFGHEIKVVGKTRKGLPVYALFDAA